MVSPSVGRVDAAAATGGRVPKRRLRAVRRELRPWWDEAFVADLDDHLQAAFLSDPDQSELAAGVPDGGPPR